MNRLNPKVRRVLNYVFIFVGSIIAAAGLEIFLIPNDIIDGGVVGISIMVSHLTGIPLGILTFVINIPFLYIGYKQIGKTFLFSSLFAIASFSFWVQMFYEHFWLTHDMLLASVFGGIILGAGVGIIIRFGASLDGTEMVSIIISKNTSFSVGQLVLIFNIFILSLAALVFGWDKALYSLITYFIASKVIDIAVDGLDEAKAAMIVSGNAPEIADAIFARLGRSVTYLDGEGGYSHDKVKVIYTVVTRVEIAKLKNIIFDKDKNAFLTIHDVSDVLGGSYKKRSIH